MQVIFGCRCFTTIVPRPFKYHELSEQSGFDDNGKRIEGPLLSG